MPVPTRCPNPDCTAHAAPQPGWRRPFGFYETVAHGTIRRFRCRHCGTTCSTQSESMHFAAKRHLPLRMISTSLLEGASQRDIARRCGVTPMTIHNAIIRLGRQAIAAQAVLLATTTPRPRLVFDGLRTFVTSQDYPCDLTTLVDAEGETILAISHGVFRRGGRMTRLQRRRVDAKNAHWRIPAGTMRRAISRVCREIWEYLDPSDDQTPAMIDTDCHRAYRHILLRDPEYRRLRGENRVEHRTTPGTAARTMDNPLFPVNYVDRLIRHRVREHTRETIAFGRHAAMQLYRMWVFAWDMNTRRAWRVKRPEAGRHAERGTFTEEGLRAMRRINRTFYRRRVDIRGCRVPASLREAWIADVVTPPIRWKDGQSGTSVRLPAYARRDLERGLPAVA